MKFFDILVRGGNDIDYELSCLLKSLIFLFFQRSKINGCFFGDWPATPHSLIGKGFSQSCVGVGSRKTEYISLPFQQNVPTYHTEIRRRIKIWKDNSQKVINVARHRKYL